VTSAPLGDVEDDVRATRSTGPLPDLVPARNARGVDRWLSVFPLAGIVALIALVLDAHPWFGVLAFVVLTGIGVLLILRIQPPMKPSPAERWRILRKKLGGIVGTDLWRELEQVSPLPHEASLVVAVGADPDGVRWSDFVTLAVTTDGNATVQRVHRRFVSATRAEIETLVDTRTNGDGPTSFDPRRLQAPGKQDQISDLRRYLERQGVVPAAALEPMFWPDRAYVSTSSLGEESVPNVTFVCSWGDWSWRVHVGPTKHLRVTRERITADAPR
jgi:hypothetical protein